MKKSVFILVIIFATVSYNCPARSIQNVDSLIKLLNGATADSSKIKLLIEISRNLLDYPDSSLLYSNMAWELAKKNNYLNSQARALASIGEAYNGKGNYNMSLKYFYDSYAIYEKLGNKIAMNTVMNSIANAHMGNKDNDKAIAAFKNSYQLTVSISDTGGIGLAAFGIGNIYGEMNMLDSSVKYISLAIKCFKRTGYTYAEAMSYALKGQVETVQEKYSDALISLNKALEMFSTMKQLYGISVTENAIGKLFFKQGNYKTALKHYLAGQEINIKRKALDNISAGYLDLASVYNKLGDYKSAYDAHQQYVLYKDSIFNEQSRKQLLEIETKFETEKKQKEIEIKTLQLEKSNNEVKSRTIYLYIFIGVSVIFLILGMFVLKQYKQKQKDNVRISFQKNLIEEKNKSITDSIRYAQYIQESILPDDDMCYQLLRESFVYFNPKDIVSGDFYWIVESEGYVYVAAVDCTGHGVPGAFMSMAGHNALNTVLKNKKSPTTAQILSLLQDEISEMFRHSYRNSEVRDGMDLSIIRLDRKNMTVQFSGANNPLYLVRNKELAEYKGDKVAISATNEGTVFIFTTHTISLQKGDCIYLFSDGYADQFGGNDGKKFKYSRLKETLVATSDQPMHLQRKNIDDTFKSWKGGLEQVDDVLVIGIKI